VKHISEEAWSDSVRGVGSASAKREIADHLASGCPDCVAARDIWAKVFLIAGNESSLTPPDYAVRMAKLALPAGASTPSPWSLATLVFDSLSQPLTAGIRSGATDTRQMMFEAEGTMVDFVLDTGRESGTVSLIGQVVDRNGTKVAPRRVAVILWTESGQPMAETSANEFGEFQLEFAPQDRLRVSVEIAGHKSIRIPPINLNGPDAIRSVT